MHKRSCHTINLAKAWTLYSTPRAIRIYVRTGMIGLQAACTHHLTGKMSSCLKHFSHIWMQTVRVVFLKRSNIVLAYHGPNIWYCTGSCRHSHYLATMAMHGGRRPNSSYYRLQRSQGKVQNTYAAQCRFIPNHDGGVSLSADPTAQCSWRFANGSVVAICRCALRGARYRTYV